MFLECIYETEYLHDHFLLFGTTEQNVLDFVYLR